MLYTVKMCSNGSEVKEAFKKSGRENQFSDEGYELLASYYNDDADDVELNPVDLSCMFSEHESITDAASELALTVRELQQRTEILKLVNGRVIIRNI